MNPFEKKLEKSASKSVVKHEKIVSDVKLLLDNNAQEEAATLRAIGLDNDLNYAESKKQDVIIRTEHGQRLERTVVSRRELDDLCLKYRLYMRPTREYRGTIPPELGAELNRFCKEKGIVLPAHNSYSRFFIVAPPKMFEGYTSPVDVVRNAIGFANEMERERQRLKDLDPILVYQLDDNSKYYAIIKSWGHDFTWLRRLYAILTSRISMRITLLFFTICFLFGLWEIGVWQGRFFINLGEAVEGEDLWVVPAIVGWAVVGILGALWLFHEFAIDVRKRIFRIVTHDEERIINSRKKR